MVYNVMELINEINETRTQVSACAKDELRVMTAMLNDPNFVVDVYGKEGVIGQYCPYEDSRNMISNVIKSTTKISTKEANILAQDYEFTKQDANTFINISKEFINTYVETGRKLPLGGREKSNVALSKKVKNERNNNFPKKTDVDNNGSTVYEYCEDGVIPTHNSIRVHSSCPPWLK